MKLNRLFLAAFLLLDLLMGRVLFYQWQHAAEACAKSVRLVAK